MGWHSLVLWECEIFKLTADRGTDSGIPGAYRFKKSLDCQRCLMALIIGLAYYLLTTNAFIVFQGMDKDDASGNMVVFLRRNGPGPGLDQAGLAPTLANELDAVCCRTIRLNRPDLDLIEGSICNVNGAGLRRRRRFDGEVYLMVGGPPCQSFSSGGKRAGLTGACGNLIYEYFRLIAEVRPRYFVMENVANLATAALRHRPIADRPGKHWNLRYYERPQLAMFDGVAALQPDEMAWQRTSTDRQRRGWGSGTMSGLLLSTPPITAHLSTVSGL